MKQREVYGDFDDTLSHFRQQSGVLSLSRIRLINVSGTAS